MKPTVATSHSQRAARLLAIDDQKWVLCLSSTLHLETLPSLFHFTTVSLRVPPRPHLASSTITILSTFKHINVDQYDNDKFYCNNIT